MGESKPEAPWCLIANLREGRSPIAKGARCYCKPWFSGDGYESIPLVVRSRGGRIIETYLNWSHLTNFRVKQVYEPAFLKRVDPWKEKEARETAEALIRREKRWLVDGMSKRQALRGEE